VSPELAPPSGEPPPTTAASADGESVDLRPLAEAVCRRYRAEFPDERERYGDAGIAWCIHDNQHILNWAFLEQRGHVDLGEQITWLGRVLGARDFPLDRLARNLELAAEVVEEEVPAATAVAERLRQNAAAMTSS
jgi:hypothetical protein